MANTFSPDFKDVWARSQQESLIRTVVARMIADLSFESQLSSGDVLNRPYRSFDRPAVYTRGADITIDDKTDIQESLSVNAQYANGFYIDDFDKIQTDYDLAAEYGKDVAMELSGQIDADIFGDYSVASSVVDNADISGSAGQAISLTTSNVMQVFAVAKQKLMKQNVNPEELFAVVSPEVETVLMQAGAGRDTQFGDQAFENGFFGRFYGFRLHRSNRLSGSARLALATQPTNNDTVVIAGVTFTLVSSIGSTAGNVLIGVDVDTTRANLTAAINNPSTTSATQVALSAANQRFFTNHASATNDNTNNVMDVVFKGIGALVVSETLTDATDGWTANRVKQHNVFGARGATTLVVQKTPKLEFKQEPKRFGGNILAGVLYGWKTFNKGAKKLVNVEIQGNTYAVPSTN